MPDRVKEKLVEIVCEGMEDGCVGHCNHPPCFQVERVVNALLENGVTVQEECNACATATQEVFASLQGKIAELSKAQEWISVKDRFPDTIPCGAGTAYSEAVNVLTDGRKVLTAIWNGSYWICDAEFWDAEFEEITHWTPVLLPLPQPPKGE